MFSESCNTASLQWIRGMNAEHKNNEDKTQAIYFSHRRRLVKTHLTLQGRNYPFVYYMETTNRNHHRQGFQIIFSCLLPFQK